MKVSELSGALLDYWVARANGYDGRIVVSTSLSNADYFELASGTPFRPSTHWAHGGPIIDRERITIAAVGKHDKRWFAEINGFEADTGVEVGHGKYSAEGETPLVAAMRAHVASKYGDDVPDVAP